MADHVVKVALTDEQRTEMQKRISNLWSVSCEASRKSGKLSLKIVEQRKIIADCNEQIKKLERDLAYNYVEIHPVKEGSL
jgi:septal ring factor EnvC (AmiA/AmiB activator)